MKRALLLLMVSTALVACKPNDEPKNVKEDNLFEKLGISRNDSNTMVDIEPLHTTSGAYLIGRHAQIEQDWRTAGLSFSKLLADSHFENIDLLKRAMVLSVGSGEIEVAAQLASKIVETGDKDSALAQLILTLKSVKNNDFAQANKDLQSMAKGGVAEIVKPALSPWLSYADTKKLPPLKPVSNGLTVYNEILAADLANDEDRLKILATQYTNRATLSSKLREQIGDILVSHNLKDDALNVYKKISLDQDIDTVNAKIELLESNKDVPQDLLYKGVDNVLDGIGLAMTDMSVLFYQESGTDSARIFAHLALYVSDNQEDAQALLAHMAADTGRTAEAIAYFGSITPDKGEEYVRAQRQIARLYEDLDDYPLATKTLEKLVSETDNLEAQIQLGDIYRHEEQFRKALNAYNKAFKMIDDPDDEKYWSLYYSRGIALERVGKMDDAEKDLRKALSFKPDHPFILNYLGYSFADKGENLDEALQMIQKAVELEPEDGYIADSLGWVYFRMGRYEEALPHLEDAAEFLPYDPTVNDHLGDLYWQLGRKQEARFQWRRALSNTDVEEDKPSIEAKIDNGLESPEIMKEAKR